MLFVLLGIGFCAASPIRTENHSIFGIPIFVYDSTGLEVKSEDESFPTASIFLVTPTETQDPLESSVIAKRSAENQAELEDLETAAGTNALRPLFVYRQQVAYRQRIRDAIRRGNRF